MEKRQTRIEGTEPTSFPDMNEAAEAFLYARQKKKDAAEFAKDAAEFAKDAAEFAKDAEESLVTKMRKREMLHYRDAGAGLEIELDTKDRIKVRKIRKAAI